MKALVLNDTRREGCRHHLGCHTVMGNLLRLCGYADIEVVATIPRADACNAPEFHRLLPSVDLIVVNGEGTMHHDAPGALQLAEAIWFAKSRGKRTALLNTVWQENRVANTCLASLDFIHARDSFSAAQLAPLYRGELVLAPDLCMGRDPACDDAASPSSTGFHSAAPCIVADSVHETDTRRLYDYAARHRLPFRVMQIWAGRPSIGLHPAARSRFLARDDFRSETVLLSGRFHAACLALKHRTPFLVLPSNTHKIEALLHDADLPPEDYLLPPDWDAQPLSHWLEHARTAHARHHEQIAAFADDSHRSVEDVFRHLKDRLHISPQSWAFAHD